MRTLPDSHLNTTFDNNSIQFSGYSIVFRSHDHMLFLPIPTSCFKHGDDVFWRIIGLNIVN